MQTVICMKWGTAYGAEYANTLFSMVRRNTGRPLRFVCFTDDTTGLRPEIEALPLPEIALPALIRWTPWRKISLWQDNLADLAGPVLFLDLDVVVTGSIDPFFDFRPKADFCVIENWTTAGSGVGNTSAFRLRVGSHPEVYAALTDNPQRVLADFTNEQTLASRMVPDLAFWPAEWCVSFKHDLLPPWPLNFIKPARFPKDARVTCFTGHPNPDEARDGVWPAPWYKRLRRHVRPTPWIAQHWR